MTDFEMTDHPLFGKKMPGLQRMVDSLRQTGDPDDFRIASTISKLRAEGLIEEMPDGKIRVIGTTAQIERAGLTLDGLQSTLEEGYREADAEVGRLESVLDQHTFKRNAILQKMAWLQQQAGETPDFQDDGLYVVHDPRGGNTPMAIPGSMIRDFFASGFGDDYRLVGQDEMSKDPTMNVNMVVGFEPDKAHMPAEIQRFKTKPQGFVDLQ